LLHDIVRYFLKPLTNYNSWHCSLLFGSFPGTGPLSFAMFFVTSACLSVVILIFFFFLLQCNLILKTVDQRQQSFADNKLKWVSFSLKIPSRKDSSAPLLGLLRDSPPPSSVRTDGRTDVRTYGDVITKFSRLDGLPIFLTHGASRAEAPLLRRRRMKMLRVIISILKISTDRCSFCHLCWFWKEKIDTCLLSDRRSYTSTYQSHRACGFGYNVVCYGYQKHSKPVEIYRGEDAVEKFIQKMF